MKNTEVILKILLDSIEKILNYTKSYEFENFCENEMVFDACLMQFQHLGEQTNKYKTKLEKLDFLPINEIIGLRNYIAHEYLGISKKIIFYTIQNDLPFLKNEIKDFLNSKNLNS